MCRTCTPSTRAIDVDQVIGVLLLPAGSTYDLEKGLHSVADSAKGTVISSVNPPLDYDAFVASVHPTPH